MHDDVFPPTTVSCSIPLAILSYNWHRQYSLKILKKKYMARARPKSLTAESGELIRRSSDKGLNSLDVDRDEIQKLLGKFVLNDENIDEEALAVCHSRESAQQNHVLL